MILRREVGKKLLRLARLYSFSPLFLQSSSSFSYILSNDVVIGLYAMH